MITPTQNKLLSLAREKGFVTIRDTYIFYLTAGARMGALKQLVSHGYIKRSSIPDRFNYVKG